MTEEREGVGEKRKDKGYKINGDARRSGRKDKEEGGIEEALEKIPYSSRGRRKDGKKKKNNLEDTLE